MAWPQNPELRAGDEAKIMANDSGNWGHGLKVGTIVVLKHFDSSDDSWKVQATDEKGMSWETWIAQGDLVPAFDPVTDDEIAALFGTTKEA